MNLKKAIKNIAPRSAIRLWRRLKNYDRAEKERSDKVADYLAAQGDNELLNIAKFLRKSWRLVVFPYSYTEKYEDMTVAVSRDNDGYPYVIHNGNKLFGPKEWSDEKWCSYYIGLLMEQDKKSPHCYLNSDVALRKNDVVADIGAAEGIFALDIIDRALLCQYHKADDEKVIKAKLSEYGFSYRDNEGYMLFLFDENGLLPPYVRRGVLYAVRGQNN